MSAAIRLACAPAQSKTSAIHPMRLAAMLDFMDCFLSSK